MVFKRYYDSFYSIFKYFLVYLFILFILVLTTLIAIINATGTVRGYFASYDFDWDAMSMYVTTEEWFVSCLLITVHHFILDPFQSFVFQRVVWFMAMDLYW